MQLTATGLNYYEITLLNGLCEPPYSETVSHIVQAKTAEDAWFIAEKTICHKEMCMDGVVTSCPVAIIAREG